MAKVAKKSASSSKKSVASAKPAAKKADKQKKTTVKATPTASKKKAAPKVVAKKSAPAKAAAKKVVAKKTSKPVVPAKKAPIKAVKVVASKKAAPKTKVAAKKTAAKVDVKSTKTSPSSKKANAPALVKGKVVPVKTAKPASVKTVAAAKPEKTVSQKAKPAEIKKATVTPVQGSAPIAKAAAAGKPRRKNKKNDDDDDDEEEVVFRKPAKKVASAVKKSSSKHISEELTMEGPAPKRIGQITMTSDEKIKLKKALLNKCIDIQKNTVSIAKKAMEDALTSANAEKVSEELSDSFRESMHATRDMYARQANEGVNNLGLLNRINIVEHEKVKFGSVVFTNFQNYFISTGLGEIKVDDLSFQAVSTLAPLFQILVDKKKGDTFMFLDRLYTVIEVF